MDVNENGFALSKIERENIKQKEIINKLTEILSEMSDVGQDITTDPATLESGFYIQYKKQNGGVGYRPDFHGMVDYIIKEYHLISSEAYSYIYINGYYKYIGRLGLANIISQIAKDKLQPTHLESFIRLLLAKSFNKERALLSTDGFINLSNGILNVKTRELMPNSPKYFFKYKLPHKYDPSATCPRFKQFLNFIFSGDKASIQLVAEMFGYCLLGGNPFLHKAFILYGEGRNGKSTMLDVLEGLLGSENISKVSLLNLSKPFSAVNLDGKLANIVNEGPSDRINAEAFKTAVGGGHLTAAHKGKPEYNVQCYARFICATNSIPKFNETSFGIKERLCFLKFDKIIQESDRDPDVGPYIIANELAGVLNMALDGVAELLKRRFVIPTEGHSEIMQEFKIDSDSVFEFYENRLIVDVNSKSIILSEQLYAGYKTYCENIGRRALSLSPFAKRLNGILKSEVSVDLKYRNEKRRGFYGLTLGVETSHLTLLMP